MTKDDELIEQMREALELMYSAWAMLIPCLKYSSVKDYLLVTNTAPTAYRKAIAAVKEREVR